MRILFVTPEVHPLVKTGGLGDVSAALPRALAALGLDVRVLVPGYPAVRESVALRRVASGVGLLPGIGADLLLGELPDGGPPLYVVGSRALYTRPGGPYQDDAGRDWPDNAQRFAALARMAALLGSAATPIDWQAQIVHGNDWQCGLAPAYLAFAPIERAATVMTVHNLSFPGAFPSALVPALALPWEGFGIEGFEFHGALGFLKAGLHYADHVTAVSPGYAAEIRTATYGHGLHGLLERRREALTGILNGIDVGDWNPAADPHLAARYDADRLARKSANRSALRDTLGLADDPDVPLIGMVTRLTWQKGVDLVPPALDAIAERPFQLVVLGSGDAANERAFTGLEAAAPDRVRFLHGFDEPLAHRIEAGADLFLMPSRFEPCGLNQMYSMRYGTPPVVRRTGGLADTVTDATPDAVRDGTATGFVFDAPDAGALAGAVARALDLRTHPRLWRRVQRAGMDRDFSWARSAEAYRDLYATLVDRT